jgi:hypothetical protein
VLFAGEFQVQVRHHGAWRDVADAHCYIARAAQVPPERVQLRGNHVLAKLPRTPHRPDVPALVRACDEHSPAQWIALPLEMDGERPFEEIAAPIHIQVVQELLDIDLYFLRGLNSLERRGDRLP